jgi:cytochrome P450
MAIDQVAELPQLPLPHERECPFDPPPEYARLRAEAPVSRVLCPTGISAWLVTRYADAREVLGDPERFITRPGQASHVLASVGIDAPSIEGVFPRLDGSEHLRYRRQLAPEVSAYKRISELRPLVQRIVDEKVDHLARLGPPIDLYGQFASDITTTVIGEMIGVPQAERGLFQRAAAALYNPATTGESFLAALQPLFEYVFALVSSRREAPGDDAISRMITRSEQTDQPFTDIELVTMSGALLIAGFDSTASMISYGLLLLLAHPDQWTRLREDPQLAGTAAEELVRHLAAGNGLLRQATRDTDIGGKPIATGDFVVVAVQAANRDPQLYPDADRLDVARKPGAHLGFGHGPHQCLGQHLARLELSTVLGTLARRIPSLRLAVPLAEIEFKTDSVVRGPAALPVTWDEVLPGEDS